MCALAIKKTRTAFQKKGQKEDVMAKNSERTTGVHDDGIVKSEHTFRVSKSKDENTKTFQGEEGKNAPHYTEHADGSRWKTDSAGNKEKIGSGDDKDKPKK